MLAGASDPKVEFTVTLSITSDQNPEDATYDLPEDKELLIGSGEHCDIKCNDLLADRNHCFIRVVNGEIWFTDNYSSYGSFIKANTKELCSLPASAFCLGNTLFNITQKDKSTFEVEKIGASSRQTFTVVVPADIKVGRDVSDKISVPEDETISVHHAQLKFDLTSRSWQIKDHGRTGNGSSNGTWIKLAVPTTIVTHEDIIRIGKELFLVFARK